MPYELGYNTNGFAHHRIEDAIDILAEIGYDSVAITLDHHALNPYADDFRQQAHRIKQRLQARNLCCVVETGSRFLLDPWRKHWPTLITPNDENRARRIDFLDRAMQIAAILEAECVSFWSGAAEPGTSDADNWPLLIDTCDRLLTLAVQRDVFLAFEPEPGMFIERMDQYARLARELNHPRFGLTLDLGHVHCLGDGTPDERIREWSAEIYNIHIEDMRRGTHEHLMFGEGEMDFAAIFKALDAAAYHGTVNVELSRHGFDAVSAARKGYDFLSALMPPILAGHEGVQG